MLEVLAAWTPGIQTRANCLRQREVKPGARCVPPHPTPPPPHEMDTLRFEPRASRRLSASCRKYRPAPTPDILQTRPQPRAQCRALPPPPPLPLHSLFLSQTYCPPAPTHEQTGDRAQSLPSASTLIEPWENVSNCERGRTSLSDCGGFQGITRSLWYSSELSCCNTLGKSATMR